MISIEVEHNARSVDKDKWMSDNGREREGFLFLKMTVKRMLVVALDGENS